MLQRGHVLKFTRIKTDQNKRKFEKFLFSSFIELFEVPKMSGSIPETDLCRDFESMHLVKYDKFLEI